MQILYAIRVSSINLSLRLYYWTPIRLGYIVSNFYIYKITPTP